MTMQAKSWRPRCQKCGKAGPKRTSLLGNKPTSAPTLTGKCPASPNGIHQVVWEEC